MFVYRTIILTLPPALDIFSISWLSVWSQSLQSSFAEIEIPRQLNVPPAAKILGISPQVGTVATISNRCIEKRCNKVLTFLCFCAHDL